MGRMDARSFNLPAALALLFILLLAACGGSEDDGESAGTVATPTSTATTDTETVDDRTPEQIAIDELDVAMYQLGIRDLETVSDCVQDLSLIHI